MILDQHGRPVIVPTGDGVVGNFAVQPFPHPAQQFVVAGTDPHIIPLDFPVQLALHHAPIDALDPTQFGQQIRVGDEVFPPGRDLFPVFALDKSVNPGLVLLYQPVDDVALPAAALQVERAGQFPQVRHGNGVQLLDGQVKPGGHSCNTSGGPAFGTARCIRA